MKFSLNTYLNLSAILLIITYSSTLASCSEKTDIPEKVKVNVFRVNESEMTAGLNYSGVIEAGSTASLSFLSMGTVKQVHVREGDKVRKGQLLAELDKETAENSMKMAKDKLKQAEDGYNRVKPMYDHGNLPEIKMVEIQTQLNQAALAAKIAEKQVKDCYIFSPMNGYIGSRRIEPGDSVLPAVPVITVMSVKKTNALISVPEKEIMKIKKGMPASVKLSRGETLNAKITDIGIMSDPLSRTYSVRAMLDNASGRLRPGMLCEVYLKSGKEKNGITIPASAITIDSEGNEFIYAADESSHTVKKIPVKSSGFSKDGIIISQGLSGNELIVREGAHKLSEGMTVEYGEEENHAPLNEQNRVLP